jgi:hypothetical protein
VVGKMTRVARTLNSTMRAAVEQKFAVMTLHSRE